MFFFCCDFNIRLILINCFLSCCVNPHTEENHNRNEDSLHKHPIFFWLILHVVFYNKSLTLSPFIVQNQSFDSLAGLGRLDLERLLLSEASKLF